MIGGKEGGVSSGWAMIEIVIFQPCSKGVQMTRQNGLKSLVVHITQLHLPRMEKFFHTAALTKDGKLFTWGNNRQGDLGHGGRKKSRNIPTNVERSLDGLVIVKSHVVEFITLSLQIRGKYTHGT